MYQRIRVMSHGLVCKMVNLGTNFHFYINPKNERGCHNRPCKSTHEPCKNIVRVLNSVPCAYVGVSLRDCAVHSSGWGELAGFGSMGFRFFVQLVKMVRAFVNKTTARSRCVRVFVTLCSVAYVPISCLPHMAIMCHHERGFKDIFAHTLRHLLVEDVHFLSLGPPG
jgi:hypothetical protein